LEEAKGGGRLMAGNIRSWGQSAVFQCKDRKGVFIEHMPTHWAIPVFRGSTALRFLA